MKFCEERGLYLDRHGSRIGVRSGKKVSWEDKYGNSHDLDFVIEKDGSPDKRGRPVAFIEAAWRRYTKHSRNKAQEIQGAVLPIADKYEQEMPFLGAVLAGIFTKGSLDQLKSVGFNTIYLPYETIIGSFKAVGIDARFDEKTPDSDFLKCIQHIENLSGSDRGNLKNNLLLSNQKAFDEFFTALRRKLDRIINRISIMPLFGGVSSFNQVGDAIGFIDGFDTTSVSGDFQKYELIVTFSNKDEIRAVFTSKDRAKEFLKHVTS